MTTLRSSIKNGPVAVRVDAALLADGAFDDPATAEVIDVQGARRAMLYVRYTRGTAGGAPAIKVLWSDDNVDFGAEAIADGSSLDSSAVTVSQLQYELPAPASDDEVLYPLPIDDVELAGWMVVLSAEYGAVGMYDTPGTCSITCILAT